MKFEDAIAKSVQTFLEGKVPENLAALTDSGLKYTKEYFDDFADELASSKPQEKTKNEK
jgi:hypothetical protein